MGDFEMLKDFGDTTIHKHGNSYDDAKDVNDKYPFCICPECMSQNTRVNMSIDVHDGIYTGFREKVKYGIFYYKSVYVNYVCDDCLCSWQKQYICKHNRHKILSDDVDKNVVIFVISFLIFVFLVVSTVCAINICNLYAVDSAPWHIKLWAVSSIFGSAISGMISLLKLLGA